MMLIQRNTLGFESEDINTHDIGEKLHLIFGIYYRPMLRKNAFSHCPYS